jgi:molecular chaperone DnaK
MNRSRAIAAGTSVGALVVLTAGVAVANPGSHTSRARASTSSDTRSPAVGSNDSSSGADSGWLGGSDDNSGASDGSTDPNSGFVSGQPGTGPGSFDPGGGSGGSTSSGGS